MPWDAQGLNDEDDGKATRTLFGVAWLGAAVHGLVSTASSATGTAAGSASLNWDLLAWNFTLWFLAPLAVSLMFFRSWRNGMVVLLGVLGVQPAKALLDAAHLIQRGGALLPVHLATPLLLLTFVIASCVACASCCGPRMVRLGSPLRRHL